VVKVTTDMNRKSWVQGLCGARRRATVLAGLGLLAACGAGAAPVSGQGRLWPTTPRMGEGTDRLIVHYKDRGAALGLDAAHLSRAQSVGQQWGVSIVHRRRTGLGSDVLQLGRRLASPDLQALAAAMKQQDSSIDFVEPDRVMHALSTGTDPLLSQQWSLFDPTGGIQAIYAWSASWGAGQVVAVVDTGVRPHVDLQDNLLSGYDFVSTTFVSNDGDARDADPSDPGDWVTAGYCSTDAAAANSSWHGTHVAGIVAAVAGNGEGVMGVAPQAKVLPVRVLGRCGGYTSDIADGVIWAAGGSVAGVPANTHPARVINLSLGGSGACATTTQTAINKARSLGAVVVVAAGNDGADASQTSPANCNGVITVAATNRSGGRTWYSNTGSNVTLAAPGGDDSGWILSTLNDGTTTPGSDSYAYYGGTSMATPHVSGTVALMLARDPSLTPDQVRSILTSTARPFPASCDGCGAGIVNALDAVLAASDLVASTSSTTTVTEIEPNNAVSSAQSLSSLPVVVQGSSSSSSDADFYKVTLAGGVAVAATLTPQAGSTRSVCV